MTKNIIQFKKLYNTTDKKNGKPVMWMILERGDISLEKYMKT